MDRLKWWWCKFCYMLTGASPNSHMFKWAIKYLLYGDYENFKKPINRPDVSYEESSKQTFDAVKSALEQ